MIRGKDLKYLYLNNADSLNFWFIFLSLGKHQAFKINQEMKDGRRQQTKPFSMSVTIMENTTQK